jgi:hypothetical protein
MTIIIIKILRRDIGIPEKNTMYFNQGTFRGLSITCQKKIT